MKKIYLFGISSAFIFMIWESREFLIRTMLWFGDKNAVAISMGNTGISGPIVLFILFVLQVFLAFIPGQALMVACGYLYGFWGGFLLSWFSLVAGGEMAFILARRYGRPFAERWISPQVLSKWDKAARGQGIGFFAFSLLLPLIPNDAMCYVAGLGKISRPHFFTANVLGRGMACVLTSAAGAFGENIPWQGWVALISIFILIGIGWRFLKVKNS